MRLSEEAGGSAEEGEGEAVVMVGVKLDGKSRELLTWALVKVARPGDRVLALHVIDSSTPSAVGATFSISTPSLPLFHVSILSLSFGDLIL